MKRDSIGPIILIFIGTIFLLNNFNVLPWTVWTGILKLWPLIIILTGIQLIIGRSLVATITMTLITVALVIAIFWWIFMQYQPNVWLFNQNWMWKSLNEISNF